jgi:tryptophanyl-tRNA synthetase
MLQVKAHSELMWILSCTASMGYLSRMTQWKVCLSLFEPDQGANTLTEQAAARSRSISFGFQQ